MKCSGLHCPRCRHSDGGGAGTGAVIALIVLAVIAASRRAIGHAVGVALHILEVAAAAAAALAVAAGVIAAVLVIRRAAARRATVRAARERTETPASVTVLGPGRPAAAELPAPPPIRAVSVGPTAWGTAGERRVVARTDRAAHPPGRGARRTNAAGR